MIKYFKLTIFLCILSFSIQAQTQMEMNNEAKLNYQNSDKELNTTYQKILKEYNTDTIFIRNLKTSQKLWIQFRDAEMLTMYPKREPYYYGSVHSMCWFMYLQELTDERIKKLQVWLQGIDEGEVCGSSIKINSK